MKQAIILAAVGALLVGAWAINQPTPAPALTVHRIDIKQRPPMIPTRGDWRHSGER